MPFGSLSSLSQKDLFGYFFSIKRLKLPFVLERTRFELFLNNSGEVLGRGRKMPDFVAASSQH